MNKIVAMIVSMSSVPLVAGVLGTDPDAPILIKTAEWLLGFMSKSIQSQAIAYTAWFVTIMVAVQGVARGIAELLGLFADKTKTNFDNKAMLWLSNVALWCGKIIGWFGVGFPKSIK
jgi:hypothetical protein